MSKMKERIKDYKEDLKYEEEVEKLKKEGIYPPKIDLPNWMKQKKFR